MNQGLCTLCDRHDESINHLLLQSPFSRMVWFRVLQSMGLQRLLPLSAAVRQVWWPDQAERIMNIINTYANATRQLINYDKCSISFGEHCPSEIKNQVNSVLQVHADETHKKYLRLPTREGRMHKGRFSNLQE
jgi:hypothetical protein